MIPQVAFPSVWLEGQRPWLPGLGTRITADLGSRHLSKPFGKDRLQSTIFFKGIYGIYPSFQGEYTLLGTKISPEKSILKMIFLFPRWDMLISWRVSGLCLVISKWEARMAIFPTKWSEQRATRRWGWWVPSTRWWQLKYVLFSPRKFGEDDSHFDVHIFSTGLKLQPPTRPDIFSKIEVSHQLPSLKQKTFSHLNF